MLGREQHLYDLNLADCITNFRNLDRKKRKKVWKVQRGLFWENWAQVTTYMEKKQSHKNIGGILNISTSLVHANPPTSQI